LAIVGRILKKGSHFEDSDVDEKIVFKRTLLKIEERVVWVHLAWCLDKLRIPVKEVKVTVKVAFAGPIQHCSLIVLSPLNGSFLHLQRRSAPSGARGLYQRRKEA
jgi:hypothetical protein